MESQTPPPQLPIFSLPSTKLTPSFHQNAAVSTPPHHAAAVPFRWEEIPGKPLPSTSTAIVPLPPYKSLDLPPRLLYDPKFIKTPSPTTVLDGPYVRARSLSHSSRSFRFKVNRGLVPFDGATSAGSSPERGFFGSSRGERGFRFRGWGRSSKKDGGGEGSFRFSGDGIGGGGKAVEVRKKRSQMGGLSQAKSHFWATIYGAFKQVIPRKSAKWKKEAF